MANEILKSTGLPASFDYIVERYGNLYFAGASSVVYNCINHIEGQVFLYRNSKLQSRQWKPKITNPFYSEIKENQFFVREFEVKRVDLESFEMSFRGFSSNLNMNLREYYDRELRTEDLEALYSKLYEYYKKFSRRSY